MRVWIIKICISKRNGDSRICCWSSHNPSRGETTSSDEPHCRLSGFVDKQNCRTRADEIPHVVHVLPFHAQNVTVWCVLWPQWLTSIFWKWCRVSSFYELKALHEPDNGLFVAITGKWWPVFVQQDEIRTRDSDYRIITRRASWKGSFTEYWCAISLQLFLVGLCKTEDLHE